MARLLVYLIYLLCLYGPFFFIIFSVSYRAVRYVYRKLVIIDVPLSNGEPRREWPFTP